MRRQGARLTAAITALLVSVAAVSCSGGDQGGEVTEINLATVEAPWYDGYQRMVDAYEEETGITVNVTAFPFDGLLTQQANAAQSGSNAFDLFLVNEQWVGQFYDNGWLQPLTDVDPGFTWDDGLIEFDGVGRWNSDLRTTTSDGEIYSLPVNGNIHEFMYRADVYDALGLKVPTTWDGVVANGKEAVDSDAVENGYVLRGRTPSFDFSAVLYSYGGSFFADETAGDYTSMVDTPEFRESLQMFKQLANLGPSAPQIMAQAEAISLMQSGSTLQANLVTASGAPLEDEGASLVAGKVGYAALPGGTPVSGVWTMGVPVGLPEDRADAGMDFLAWLTSQQAQQQWADLGGATTRSDIKSGRPELKVLIESAADVRGGFRYPFTPEFLDVTEPALGAWVAGQADEDQTVETIQSGLQRVVDDAGFGS